MAITTDLQLANAALYRVGAKEITALDDGSRNANVVNALFDSTRDEVARILPWSCLLERAALTEETVATNESNEFDYMYDLSELSSACLRTVDINGNEAIVYRVEGQYLYTDQQNAVLRYIAQPAADSEGDWDSLLIDAIIARLASKIALRVSGDVQLGAVLGQEYVAMLGLAVKVEAVIQMNNLTDLVTFMQDVSPAFLFMQNSSREG